MQKNIDYLLTKGPMMVLKNINKIQNKVVKMLDDTLNLDLKGCSRHAGFIPLADFCEKGANYLIDIDLPGVDIKEVEITFKGNELTVSGQRECCAEEVPEGEECAEDVCCIEQEICYGNFERAFCMPSEVEEGKIKASYKDGVLSIIVPKTKESKAKKVKIETEAKKSSHSG
jgi:HSP20 family protein